MPIPEKSKATILDYTGTFSFDITGHGLFGETFSGAAAWQFDDSVVTGVGIEVFDPIVLSTFSLTPSVIGATSFNLANTGAKLFYIDGTLINFGVGGLVGTVTSVDVSADDFSFIWDAAGNPVSAFLSDAAFQGLTAGAQLGGSAMSAPAPPGGGSPVPEPSAALFFTAGLTVICAALRQRRA